MTGVSPQLGPITGGTQLNISGVFPLTSFALMRLTFADGAVMDSVVCTSKTGTYVICTTVDVTGIHASGTCTLSISVDNPQYVDPSHEFFSAATTPYYVHGEPRRARFASTRVTCACADLWFPSFGISPNGVVEPTITSTAPDTFEESSVTIDVGPMALMNLAVGAPLVYYSVQEEQATMLPVGMVHISVPGPSTAFSLAPNARYTALVQIPRALMMILLPSWVASPPYYDQVCVTASTLRFWMRDMITVCALLIQCTCAHASDAFLCAGYSVLG